MFSVNLSGVTDPNDVSCFLFVCVCFPMCVCVCVCVHEQPKFQLRFEQEIYYNMEFKMSEVPSFYTFEVKVILTPSLHTKIEMHTISLLRNTYF